MRLVFPRAHSALPPPSLLSPHAFAVMERVKQLTSHLTSSTGVAALLHKRPDDVVITMAIRSPLTKGAEPFPYCLNHIADANANAQRARVA